MPDLPTGTVTFLFTDIEGSTALWEQDRVVMQRAVDRHLAQLRSSIEGHGGSLYKVVGDAVQAAFPTAPQALAAAVAAQRALLAEDWGTTGPLRVRMALHAGVATPDTQGDYLAAPLNRLARLVTAGHGDQILLSGVVERLVADSLPDGVSLVPLGRHRLRDLSEPEAIFQVLAAGLPEQFPPLRSLHRPTNLAVPPTPLIGREDEVASILQLIATSTRLVTLTGPGGTGKTSLAMEIGAEALDQFSDGVYFVDLATVSDADLVRSVVASALGLREDDHQVLRETLIDYLSPKSLLLIFDNLEQIQPRQEVSRLVADLLEACPSVQILATSRAPLRLRAEREYPVPPLPTPDPQHLASLEELTDNPSVQLFVARAQAAKPSFSLTSDNAQAVASICQRLDGLPLAIELAAARIRVLAPTDLARRLGTQLDLLATHVVDRPDRQQTLRAAIAWSYDLLAPEEQALFRRVSVFAGGCTLEHAEAIASAAEPLTLDVLDGMTALVEQSLVHVDEAAETTRYRMLETLRIYGQDQLVHAGEEDQVRASHATIVLAAVQTGTAGLHGPDAAWWSEVLVTEQDNLRTALRWATDTGQSEMGLALASAAWPWWETRGYATEGRMWLDQALAASQTDASPERAEALVGAGVMARLQGDLVAAARLTEEGLSLWRHLGDRRGEGRVLRWLGVVADRQGDEARAKALFEQSLAIAREVGDELGMAVALNSLGVVLWNIGQGEAARTKYEESLAIARRTGQRSLLPLPLNNLAVLDIEAGELARARAHLQESLAIDQELGRQSGVADTLENLGAVAFEEGNLPQAGHLYGESLRIHRTLGDRVSVAYALVSMAAVAGLAGEHAAGARLYGAAAALQEAIGAPLPASEMARYERGVGQVRAGLNGSAFDAAWDAGRRLSWMQAAEEALALAEAMARRESTPASVQTTLPA